MPNISLTAPTDYAVQQADIERRRQYAQLLTQQSMQGTPTETAGGMAVPTSWTQHAAKILQGYLGGAGQKQATEQSAALAKQYQTDLGDTLNRALSAGAGTPQHMSGDASVPGDSVMTPAQGPDPQAAAAILMGHPATQALGQQQLMQNMNRQALIAALNGGSPQAAPQSAGAMPPSGGAMPSPQTGPAPGGPAGGVPMAGWLQADPTGKSYLEQLAKDATELRKPVVNRGFGIGTMTGPGGSYVPDPASSTQAATTAGAVETAKEGAKAPYSMQLMDVPVYLPGGDQINVKMNATQAHQYQMTGQLPPDIASSIPGLQQPGTAPAPAAGGAAPATTDRGRILSEEMASQQQALTRAQQSGDAAGVQSATANIAALQRELGGTAGRAVVGRTQTQNEGITQARQKAGGTAQDEAFAKDYQSFVTGGAQDTTKQLSQLQDVITELSKPGANLTGPIIGSIPNAAQNFINPKSVAMRERVEEVVQRSLRAILGAQFTEKEGERLIARAYNPHLPEAENAIRVGRLFTQLQQGLEAKQSAAKFFETNGTLQGWRGKLPSMTDFDPVGGNVGGVKGTINQANAQKGGVKFLGFEP